VEVEKAIRNIGKKKAAPPGGLQNTVLKAAEDILAKPLEVLSTV